MNTKTLFWLIAVLSLLSVSCDKNSPAGHNSENNGEKPDEPLVELPELEETDDVCTKMDDLNFMAYCYDNFDVNNDGKVSMTEANAVKEISLSEDIHSMKGIEYFSNLTSFKCGRNIEIWDFSYNNALNSITFFMPFNGTCIIASIILPNGTRDISLSASSSSYHLVVIETLDASKCKSLETFSCGSNCCIENLLLGAQDPPALTHYYRCEVLKVPAGSIEAYKNSNWANFSETIEAL